MRITSKGQVTIPQAVREQAGLLPEAEVGFIHEGGAVGIVEARDAGRYRTYFPSLRLIAPGATESGQV